MEGQRAAIAILAALVLAGCGGGEEEAAVESSIDGYLTALAEGDAAGVCRHIDPATLADVGSQESCETVYASGFELVADSGVELPDYEVSDVSIDGETATVTLDLDGREREVEAKQTDGEWKLHGATAISQFHPDLVPGEFP
jgi:ketosteroid isomerase-like protein